MAVLVRQPRHFYLLNSRLVTRFVYFVIAFALIQYYSLHLSYYEALAEKYSPTTFVNLSLSRQNALASHRWQMVVGQQDDLRTKLLENRVHWKKLGSGYEGDTFTFNESVIKVFKPDRSPLRNCVAQDAQHFQWPPEIPISLILGGCHNSSITSTSLPDQSSFLSVQDFFFLPVVGDESHGEWHLVTRFLRQVTLAHAAKRVRREVPSPTVEQVDARFRPSLNRLLDALGTMHSEYGLCHDDIKIDNIFVEDILSTVSTVASSNRTHPPEGGRDANWILGDLGNVRQISHSYHTSLLWTHDNGQHPDCRINDVLRLIRTYALFLQSATTSSKAQAQAYDEAFLTGSAPWSQLYWHTVRSAWDGTTVAQDVRKLSTAVFGPVYDSSLIEDETREAGSQPGLISGPSFSWSNGLPDSSIKAMAVTKELKTGGSASEKWAKIFGTMGILKTPSRGCRDVAGQSAFYFL